MSASSCNLSWTEWNSFCKDKYWNKFRCSCIQFFSFSGSIITTWTSHHLFLEWLWGVKDLKKLSLIKTKRSSVQIILQQENFCLTSSFTVTVFLSFACEYCHPPDNSMPTNVILIKLSFWKSVCVEYWEIKQHSDIFRFL